MLANLSGVVSESILSKFRKRNGKYLHFVVPENIHTLRGDGVQKEAISEGVGCCLEQFFSQGV